MFLHQISPCFFGEENVRPLFKVWDSNSHARIEIGLRTNGDRSIAFGKIEDLERKGEKDSGTWKGIKYQEIGVSSSPSHGAF